MYVTLLLLSLVVFGSCHHGDNDDHLHDELDEMRTKLDRLTAKLQNAADTLNKRKENHDEADRKSRNMLIRLDRLSLNDGTDHCPEKYFKCATVTQCVANILVCDKVPDCADKSDEDENLCNATAEWVYAKAIVTPNINRASSKVKGTVFFRQLVTWNKGGITEYKVTLIGFNPDDDILKHGSHIHTYGNLTKGCEGAGGHYNPTGTKHGLPHYEQRHVGDLGNVEEDNHGNVNLLTSDHVISLVGPYSIMGRTWDVHAYEDDGKGRSGHAGPRIACGVVIVGSPRDWE